MTVPVARTFVPDEQQIEAMRWPRKTKETNLEDYQEEVRHIIQWIKSKGGNVVPYENVDGSEAIEAIGILDEFDREISPYSSEWICYKQSRGFFILRNGEITERYREVKP